ncbi:protein disulfide isomerase FrnE [Streptomyces chumphonensis]|uniref:DsbA family oxidoreductase n=1 Tax=Streptomyces chumphonensis TaxID=1214925 RepID=A0A927IBG9_9ACTN|nr:DsbA family oxidoreductase [Streptomyces chumphonensis]MBD3931007.1 DsbA family oxidoreductase [Streptomyces chumphonensis]
MDIDLHFDVLCPWCYIGERRIAAAIESFSHREAVRLVRRAYELAPDQSASPGVTAAGAMEHWMSPADVPARIALIRSQGADEGIELNLHLSRPVNTFDAHRLVQLGEARGRGSEVVEALFQAYHTDAVNVADPDVLAERGVRAGLDVTEVWRLLDGDEYAERVRSDEALAAARGVRSVPSVCVDGARPVSVVKKPGDLLLELEKAWSKWQKKADTSG